MGHIAKEVACMQWMWIRLKVGFHSERGEFEMRRQRPVGEAAGRRVRSDFRMWLGKQSAEAVVSLACLVQYIHLHLVTFDAHAWPWTDWVRAAVALAVAVLLYHSRERDHSIILAFYCICILV